MIGSKGISLMVVDQLMIDDAYLEVSKPECLSFSDVPFLDLFCPNPRSKNVLSSSATEDPDGRTSI